MSDLLETDVMDELYDAAEGPAQRRYADADAWEDEFDAFGEEFDAAEDGFEDEFDEMGDFGDDTEVMDAMEEAVADALEEEDTDEFFRRVRRGLQRARQIARTVGRGVARVAPIVSRVASVIPHPAAQAVARGAMIAGRIGRALSADELDALEDLYDLAEDEDLIDAAAPVIAGLAVRQAVPNVARLPPAARRQLVRSVSQATRAVARRQGPQAARAVPPVVQAVARAVRRRRLPARAVAQAVQRTLPRVVRNTQVVRRLARTAGSGGPRRACRCRTRRATSA